jgi:hypothetical protein
MSSFDVFLSYHQQSSKDVMRGLYEKLTQTGYKVWMDIYTMNAGHLYKKIAEGINNSNVFICCVNKSYSESKNCENELSYAFEQNKNIIALMTEKLPLSELGGVGFKIANLLRVNLYKDQEFLMNGWNSEVFNKIDAQIKEYIAGNVENWSKKNSPKSSSRSITPLPSEIFNSLKFLFHFFFILLFVLVLI